MKKRLKKIYSGLMYGLAYLCSLRGDVRRVAKFTKRILELDNRIRLDIYKRLPLKRSASSFEARVSEGDVSWQRIKRI